MGEIQLELQDTINKANQLETIGSEMQNLARQDFSQIGSAIASAWKGDASDSFRRKFIKYGTKIENRGKDISKISVDLQNSVKRLQKVEELAKLIWG